MKTLGYTRAFVDRAASTDKTIRFVGATEGQKPDGINLKMDGAQLDRYRTNPIFGWGHSYYGRDNLPIGKSEQTVVDDKQRLMFDIAFDREDAFAAEAERKYRGGYLNAVSIGFSVLQWEDPKTMDYYRGGTATEWELYELSGVPLPMDANAVVDSGRSGLAVEQELLDSVRSLLNRLDPAAIAALRALIDAAAREPTQPAIEPTRTQDPADLAPLRRLMASRRLRLAGV